MTKAASNYKLVHWLRLKLLKTIFPCATEGNLYALTADRLIEFPEYLISTAYKQPDVRYEEPFAALAQKAVQSGKTLLNYDRLYTIYKTLQSVCRTNKSGCVHAVEIGVFKGGGSRFIAETLSLTTKDRLAFDCFDTFSGHDKMDLSMRKDRLDVHTTEVFQDTSIQAVRSLMEPFPFVRCHVGRFEDACSVLQSTSLDFAHLDVDLHAPTLHALEFLFPRVRVGGCIIVDDYRFLTCPGAKDAVDEFMKKQKNGFGLPLLTGQYLITKTALS